MRHARPLRQLKKEETRKAIVETAERLFLERGYDNTTLDDIAYEVMIHKKTILRYFNAKEEIALAYNRLVLEEFEQGLRDRDPSTSVVEYWRRHVARFAEEYVCRGNVSRLDEVIRSDPRLFGQMLSIDLRYESVLLDALCEEAGTQRLKDLDSRLLAAFLIAGNRSAGAPIIAGGDLKPLPAQVLSVIDKAVAMFGYTGVRAPERSRRAGRRATARS